MESKNYFSNFCKNDLLRFTRYFFIKVSGNKFVVGEHHKQICEKLNQILDGTHPTNKLIINISPRYGKCIHPNTMIYTEKGLKCAKEIKDGDMLYSYERGKLSLQRCQGIETAHKESVRITMRSGREIDCSADHPMLTTFGYKDAEKIKIGERIVALNSIVEGTHEIPDEELDFVTLMLFDGSCSTMIFSKTEESVLRVMRESCKKLGLELRHRECDRECDYSVYSYRNSKSRDLLKKYGIYGKKSTEKRLPSDWFTLSIRQRYRFIDLMFATDGYINKKNGTCGVTLANKGLITDIQHILSSLGIISTIRYKPNKCSNSWVLTIPRKYSVLLLDKISFFHKRESAESLKLKQSNCITDSFPYDIIREEKLTYKTSVPPYRCCPNKSISRDKFIRIMNEFPTLKKYYSNDFYYDRVEKIEHIGKIDLIHIGVDCTHNFIANGLVSHNTELAVKNFIAMGLAVNPQSKFIHLSYSSNLAHDNSMAVKSIVQSEHFQELFPECVVEGKNQQGCWETSQGGGLYATSTLGQITGFGAGRVQAEGEPYKFSGAIVIDDPIKPEDALSDVVRERVNRRFETTIRNRVNNRNTPIIIIMQRLHEHDLCGYLQEIEKEDWDVLSLPVIKDDGTALWDFKHTRAELEKIKEANSFVFETQYMQNPTPLEGLMYSSFKEYEELPLNTKGDQIRKNYTDTADTGADYLCSICYVETSEGMYVTDILYTKKAMEVTEPQLAMMLTRNQTQIANIESNNGGRGFARNVERIMRNELKNYDTSIVPFTQSANKQVRIFTASSRVQNLIYFPVGWEYRFPQFYQDVKGYRKEGANLHDDSVDVLSGMVEKFQQGAPMSDEDYEELELSVW